MEPPAAVEATSADPAAAGPAAAYRARLAAALDEEARADALAGRIGLLRFLCFVLAIAGLVCAWDGRPRGAPPALLWGLAVAAAAAFVALLLWHGAVLERRERARLRAEVNRQGLRRLDGTWAAVPPRPAPPSPPPYAADLDLAGAASLTLLCDATWTRHGEAALWRALCRGAAPEPAPAAARARQEAVRELAPLLDLRQSLEVAGRRLAGPALKRPDPETFLAWAESPPLLTGRRPWLRLLALLPLLTAALLALRLFVPSLAPALGWPLLALLVLQGLIVIATAGPIARMLAVVASGETALGSYGEMLTILHDAPLTAADNRALQAAVRGQGKDGAEGPARLMRRLQGDYSYLELRRNPLLWLPLNGVLLWDLFFALRLERWQAAVGPRLRGWLAAIGELEARASLASLGFDNPGWAWPELVEGPARLAAEDLGHPLLPPGRRVGNDVELPGPGRAWLITGSNMSGKSTLLRAVGLCHVMAQAGAPVCARRAKLSQLTLRTVMRVDDSLALGVSHFYAELRRLKDAVDAGRAEPPLCYLLDEILHGTNTRERELGARLVVKTLCRRGAMGAVSTHDLSLATLEEETGGAVRNVHFTEIVEGEEMRFDYRLRPGPVQTTNALRLMRQCGIDLDWEA